MGHKVATPEPTNAALVRMLIAGQYTKGHVLVADLPDPAGGDCADAVDAKQQHRQPLRGSLRPDEWFAWLDIQLMGGFLTIN